MSPVITSGEVVAPGDLAVRGLLLGYYFRRTSLEPERRLARQRHALWVIAHAPDTVFAALARA